MKALIKKLGGEPWGRSVASLLEALHEGLRSPSLREKTLFSQAYISS
ncbi:MAG: hypothetical protein ACUVTM_04450 [Candidatus Bathyarchaeia archaeon]